MADKPGCEITKANIVADGTDFGKSGQVVWDSSKAEQGCECHQLHLTGTAAAALQRQGQQRALQHANMSVWAGQMNNANNCMKAFSIRAAIVSRQPLHMMHHRTAYADESRECTIHKGYAASRKPLHQCTKQQVVRSCRQKIHSRCCRQTNVIVCVAPRGTIASARRRDQIEDADTEQLSLAMARSLQH